MTVTEPLTSAAHLMIRGPSKVESVALGREPLQIGRDPTGGLSLDGPGVSRRHCVIEPAPEGGHRVRDQGSTNGVFVNDRRVACAALESFDRIRVGEFLLIYVEGALDLEKLRAALAPVETASFDVASHDERRIDQLVWLTLMIQDARGARDLKSTVDTILDDLADLSGCSQAQALVLIERQCPGEAPHLEPVYGARPDAPALEACRAVARRALEAGEALEGPAPGGGSALAIPMRELPRVAEAVERRRAHARRPRGVLVLATAERLALAPGEGAVLEALARQLAVLISHERLERLASVDALTGLYTRTWLEEALPLELRDPPAALLLIDVDDFKKVNDVHGHAAGDEVLRTIGERVRATIRETDLAGRWGGDELVVALPGADQAGAQRVASALVRSLSTAPVGVGDRAVRPSISVGVAASPLHGSGLETLLRCADSALYAAKRAGKGRIAIYAPEGGEPMVALETTRAALRPPPAPAAGVWLQCDLLAPVALRQGAQTFGRSGVCDIVLPHPLVSRRHGVLTVEGDRVTYTDASTHGSWVNGNRILAPTPLEVGDSLSLGPYTFVLRSGVSDARDADHPTETRQRPTACFRAPRTTGV